MGISFGLLLRIALRSLLGHRVKSAIVGVILAFGTFLVVLGTTLLDNVERTMEESITGSLTGHLQLVSKEAKDELAFYGPAAMSEQDLSVIPAFATVKKEIDAIDGVKAVIPMGRHVAQGMLGNQFDELTGRMREAVRSGDEEALLDDAARVRRLVDLMRVEFTNTLDIVADESEVRANLAILDRAADDAFWERLKTEPVEVLEYLDTKVAPLSATEMDLYFPYVGTDLDAFAANYPRLKIVDGQMVPTGHKGLLFNKTFFEDFVKNKVARHLDKVKESIELDGKKIAEDKLLQEKIEQAKKHTRFVTEQLGPRDTATIEGALRELLPGTQGDLDALLREFLALTDENFPARYAFFYEKIAPKIRLYRVNVGDTLTLRALSQSGYMRAVNVKIWGTFEQDGLQRSALAGAYNLLDIMSFRDIYGLMTPEKRRELDAIKEKVGVADVSREDAEMALFGDDGGVEIEEAAGEALAELDIDAALADAAAAPVSTTFDPSQIDHGVVLHAAVVVEDPADLLSVMEEIERVSDEKSLGIRPVHWQHVSGIVGQFILVMRAVLYVAIGIIFAVALVIINNSMLMATMDRIAEIGTMRAIGAQRAFVLSLFLIETLALGLLAGGFGAAAATGLLAFFQSTGIPAGDNDVLIFLFGGPALHPELGVANVIFALCAIVAVGIASTLYPARIAARIAPVVAMQAKE